MKTHQFRTLIVRLLCAAFLASAHLAIARTSRPRLDKPPSGALPKIPHVYVTISIVGSVGASFEPGSGGVYTAPPTPVGAITVGDSSVPIPGGKPPEPFIAGDGAPKVINKWIRTIPTPGSKKREPKQVAYKCSNSRTVRGKGITASTEMAWV